jgi:hypothetical protein
VDLFAIDRLKASYMRPGCKRRAGFLLSYNFDPVDMKLIYSNTFYSKYAIGASTGLTIFLRTSFKNWSPDEGKKSIWVTK